MKKELNWDELWFVIFKPLALITLISFLFILVTMVIVLTGTVANITLGAVAIVFGIASIIIVGLVTFYVALDTFRSFNFKKYSKTSMLLVGLSIATILSFVVVSVLFPLSVDLTERFHVKQDIMTIEEAISETYKDFQDKRTFFTEIKSGTTEQNISEIFLNASTAKKIEDRLSKEFSSIRDPWGNPYILTFTQGIKNSKDEFLNNSMSELRISVSEESLKKAKDEEEIRRVVKEYSLIEFEPRYTLPQE